MSRIVLVDPQDNNEKYWWLAIVVDPLDYKVFFSEMGEAIDVHDSLVCYFEDGSYSSVSESEIKELKVDCEPFINWINEKEFCSLRAYKNYKKFVNEGKIPSKFKWLKKKKMEKESEGVFKKKVWKEKAEQVFKNV
ncbi:hypothetical protein GVAV_001046 [Gurleya vavrai]